MRLVSYAELMALPELLVSVMVTVVVPPTAAVVGVAEMEFLVVPVPAVSDPSILASGV